LDWDERCPCGFDFLPAVNETRSSLNNSSVNVNTTDHPLPDWFAGPYGSIQFAPLHSITVDENNGAIRIDRHAAAESRPATEPKSEAGQRLGQSLPVESVNETLPAMMPGLLD
jgi:hypothetical protein